MKKGLVSAWFCRLPRTPSVDGMRRKCRGVLASARPSPAAPTASLPASHACRAMRRVQLHLAICSALQGLESKSRHHDSSWQVLYNTKCADWCTSPQPKSSGSTQSFTFKSSGSTHSITLKSSGSTHPFNFKSSGSTLAFRPSCLQALVPSSGPCAFRPWRAPWALMPPGPRAFRPSCLLQVLISSLSWSSLPHMLFNCLLYLLVLCILLSDRFCHLPSWALPPHSVIMSLSDLAW